MKKRLGEENDSDCAWFIFTQSTAEFIYQVFFRLRTAFVLKQISVYLVNCLHVHIQFTKAWKKECKSKIIQTITFITLQFL